MRIIIFPSLLVQLFLLSSEDGSRLLRIFLPRELERALKLALRTQRVGVLGMVKPPPPRSLFGLSEARDLALGLAGGNIPPDCKEKLKLFLNVNKIIMAFRALKLFLLEINKTAH